MAPTATVEVKAGDLPAVQAALAGAAGTITSLRDLLKAWEPRILCPQCGQRYSEWACGPTHGIVKVLVFGDAAEPGRPPGFCRHSPAGDGNRGRSCPECGLPMLYVPVSG